MDYNLVNEFINYTPKSSERFMLLKASIVRRKCLKAGKIELAERINRKYKLGYPEHILR